MSTTPAVTFGSAHPSAPGASAAHGLRPLEAASAAGASRTATDPSCGRGGRRRPGPSGTLADVVAR